MAYCNTVLSQLLKWVPRHEFETLAKQHHSGRSFRVASRWAQFVGLFMAQVTGRDRLRDIVDNLSAQTHRLYHLGGVGLSRSKPGAHQPGQALYVVRGTVRETVATLPRGPGHKFRFSIRLMPAPSSCASRPFRGPIFERPRGRSSCMSG